MLYVISCPVCICPVRQPVLPSWTFQSSALQELWVHDPGEESDLDWSQHTPQLSPSLVPLVDGEQQQILCTSCIQASFRAGVGARVKCAHVYMFSLK